MELVFSFPNLLALISPQDLSSACSLMNSLSLSFYLHKFDSGLLSLRHKSHSEENLASLISSWISVEPLSILAVANKMNTSFIMARYQLQVQSRINFIVYGKAWNTL